MPAQQRESIESALLFHLVHCSASMESGHCTVHFHWACPPHDRGKLSQVRPNLAAGALLNAQRNQCTGIPKSCPQCSSLFHGPLFRFFVSVFKESRNRIAPTDLARQS